MPVVERRVPIIADERVDPEFGTGAREDHARPRSDGLGDRPRPRASRADGDRPRRADDRRGRRSRGALAGRGRGADPRAAEGARACSRSASVTTTRSGTATDPETGSSRSSSCSGGRDGGARRSPRSRRCGRGGCARSPSSRRRSMLGYLENIRPWCISRQLWWGHRIPVWYCGEGHITIAETEPSTCAKCGMGRPPAGRRRARHVVLVGALAVRDARVARADARARDVLPGRRLLDRARHQLLWVSRMIWAGHRADRRGCRSTTSTTTR